MEDLKKQTALRLAQEQNEPYLQQTNFVGGVGGRQQPRGQFPPNNIDSSYAYRSSDPSVSYPRQVQDNQNYTSQQEADYMRSPTENDSFIIHQQQSQLYNNQQAGGCFGTSRYDHVSYLLPPQDQNIVPPSSSTENFNVEAHGSRQYHSVDPQMLSRTTQPLQPASTVCTPPDNMHLKYQQPFMFYTPDGSYRSTVTRGNTNTSKNKLPHGLTVYELKEMTKARLQFEAAEKSNEVNEIQERCHDRVSPLDFDSGDSMRERALSRDSSTGGRISNNPVGSFQSQQGASKIVQPQAQNQSQMMQSGFRPPSCRLGDGSTPPPFRTTRNDTWESTSVASHNSTIYSENLGSECPSEVGSFGHSSHRNRAFTYPAVQPIKPLDATGNTPSSCIYKESRSFSSPSPVQASPHKGSGVLGGTSLFNAAVGGNRRRAVTLSPNTGSILEDRPFRYETFESSDRLEIPNFSARISSAPGSATTTPTQTRQREYSPVFEQLGLDNSYLSNGTEPSSVFRSLAINNGSSLPSISQITYRDLDLNEFQSTTKNKSDLFREGPTMETRTPAPPPGFVSNHTSPSGQTAFSRVGSVDSLSMNNRKTGYESSHQNQINRSHLLSEDNLLSDFGSLLDLSGSRDDRERANTYTFGSKQSIGIDAHLHDVFRF